MLTRHSTNIIQLTLPGVRVFLEFLVLISYQSDKSATERRYRQSRSRLGVYISTS